MFSVYQHQTLKMPELERMGQMEVGGGDSPLSTLRKYTGVQAMHRRVGARAKHTGRGAVQALLLGLCCVISVFEKKGRK